MGALVAGARHCRLLLEDQMAGSTRPPCSLGMYQVGYLPRISTIVGWSFYASNPFVVWILPDTGLMNVWRYPVGCKRELGHCGWTLRYLKGALVQLCGQHKPVYPQHLLPRCARSIDSSTPGAGGGYCLTTFKELRLQGLQLSWALACGCPASTRAGEPG